MVLITLGGLPSRISRQYVIVVDNTVTVFLVKYNVFLETSLTPGAASFLDVLHMAKNAQKQNTL